MPLITKMGKTDLYVTHLQAATVNVDLLALQDILEEEVLVHVNASMLEVQLNKYKPHQVLFINF